MRILFRMIANGILNTKTSGNTCLDTGVHLSMDGAEGEDNVRATAKELFDLVDRHERRSQPNIGSPLEVYLGIESEPKVVFVNAKLERDLKN